MWTLHCSNEITCDSNVGDWELSNFFDTAGTVMHYSQQMELRGLPHRSEILAESDHVGIYYLQTDPVSPHWTNHSSRYTETFGSAALLSSLVTFEWLSDVVNPSSFLTYAISFGLKSFVAERLKTGLSAQEKDLPLALYAIWPQFEHSLLDRTMFPRVDIGRLLLANEQ